MTLPCFSYLNHWSFRGFLAFSLCVSSCVLPGQSHSFNTYNNSTVTLMISRSTHLQWCPKPLTSPETRYFFPWWRLLLFLYIWCELTMLVSTMCIRPYQFYFYCIFLYCTSSFSSITLLSRQKTTSLSPIAFHWSAPSSTHFSSTSNHSSLWGEKSQLLSTAYTTCHLLLLSPGTLWSLTCWVLFCPACSDYVITHGVLPTSYTWPCAGRTLFIFPDPVHLEASLWRLFQLVFPRHGHAQ